MIHIKHIHEVIYRYLQFNLSLMFIYIVRIKFLFQILTSTGLKLQLLLQTSIFNI